METKYDADLPGAPLKHINYPIGLDQISQTTTEGGVTTWHFGYDGHGSVRALFNSTGAFASYLTISQVFLFDACGNLLNRTVANTGTTVLYSGETFDFRIGQQYLRARWYDPATGRFNRLDPFVGGQDIPQTLHKYLYANGNPISGVDPSGLFTTAQFFGGFSISTILGGAIGGTVSAIRGGNVWHGVAWGALGGAQGFTSFAGFGFLFGAASSTVGFWAATFASGFITGASIEGFASYLDGDESSEILFDAIEGGITGAALGGVFGILFRGGAAAWSRFQHSGASQPRGYNGELAPQNWIEHEVSTTRSLFASHSQNNVSTQVRLQTFFGGGTQCTSRRSRLFASGVLTAKWTQGGGTSWAHSAAADSRFGHSVVATDLVMRFKLPFIAPSVNPAVRK